MKEVVVKYAERRHKKFIIEANKRVNKLNHLPESDNLEKNIEKDYFGYNPKFKCLVAEVDSIPVAMLIYSKVYWANEGEIIWISQIYINTRYRRNGIFGKFIAKLKLDNKKAKGFCFSASRGNLRVQKLIKYYKVKQINLKFYYKENVPRVPKKEKGQIKNVSKEELEDLNIVKKEKKEPESKKQEEIVSVVENEDVINTEFEGQMNLFD